MIRSLVSALFLAAFLAAPTNLLAKGKAPPAPDANWRIRPDAKLKAHVIEHRLSSSVGAQRFAPVASFLIESARCAPVPPAVPVGPTQ